MTDAPIISFHANTALADGKQWVHLVPAGVFVGMDGRGPYDASDTEGIILNSRDAAGRRKLVIDYNHATDLARREGGAAPAAGWIVGLQGREDGVWGLVEWTPAARQHLAGQEYRYLSPALLHNSNGRVTHVLRASLTNTPNLDQLTALFSEEDQMDEEFLKQLRELLGLESTADKAAIIAALAGKLTSLNSAADPDPTKFVPIGDFQRAIAEVNGLRKGISLQAAEEHVDAAIHSGKILPWMRSWGVTLCSSNLPAFDDFLKGVGPGFSNLLKQTHAGAAPNTSLHTSGDPLTAEIAANMGHDPAEFAAFHAAATKSGE